jgi:hypothetical protein
MEEITAKSLNSPVLPSSPPLSTTLTNLYTSLDSFNKGIFMQVFKFVWAYLLGSHSQIRRRNVLYNFWLVDSIRLRLSLTTSELSALTWLYQYTNKGVKMVRSDLFYNSGVVPDLTPVSKMTLLNWLKRAGYITRHTKDPNQPYSQRAQHNKQPVFICLTRKGVQVIEGIEKDMYKLLLNSSLDELTGIKKAR